MGTPVRTHTHIKLLLRLLVWETVRYELPDGKGFSICTMPCGTQVMKEICFRINYPTILVAPRLTIFPSALLRLLVLCTLGICLDFVMVTVGCLSYFRLTSHIFHWHQGNILLELVLELSHLLPLWYQNFILFLLVAPVKVDWVQFYSHASGMALPCCACEQQILLPWQWHGSSLLLSTKEEDASSHSGYNC